MTTSVWVADLARAFRDLRPDPDTAREIAGLLGVGPARRAESAVVPTSDAVRAPAGSTAKTASRTPRGPAPELPPTVRLPDPVRRSVTVEALPVRSDARLPAALPNLGDVLRESPRVALPRTELLAPSRQRAIFSALAGRPAPSGELDVPRIVDRLVSGEALLTIPQLVRTTTRRGLQLLVDLGPSMVAFDRDQDDACRAIEQVAGPDGLEIVNFHGSPLATTGVGAGPVWEWTAYRPPPTPRPVLVLSDLGLLAADDDRRDEWLRLATVCREARCPVVALVPVPRARVPAPFARALQIVTWDRTTTVRDATIAARRAVLRRP